MSITVIAVKWLNTPKPDKRKCEAGWAMIILRIIGWILVIAAVAIFARDILASIDSGTISMIASGELWFHLHQSSLQVAEPAIARHIPVIGPWLWHPVISTILTWPATMVVGVPGILLVRLFRRRPRKDGMFR